MKILVEYLPHSQVILECSKSRS